MRRLLFIFFLVVVGFGLSHKEAYAAPFCSVAGSVQASDQAFVQVDISMDTASENANFPFKITVADTATGNTLSTNNVSITDCSITSTKRTCTYRLSGSRGLFGIPNNNTQQLSYFLQFTSNNASIVCQNSLNVPPVSTPLVCGEVYPAGTQGICPCNGNANPGVGGFGDFCCGWRDDTQQDSCSSTNPVSTPPPAGNTGTGGPGTGGGGTFDDLNNTIFGGAPDASLTTPRGIIGRLLPYLLTFGGLILFVMLIWGGFEMLTGAANPKSQEAGKQRITAAIIGFILLFASYWIAQLVQTIFGIQIL